MSTNPEKTPITAELEVIPSGALEAIERATIDVQIATAHKYPRSMQSFKSRAVEMATLDEETAVSCIYSRPVGKEKGPNGQWVQKYAEGLSVRTAEIVGACYGNLRVGAMIVEQTERFVKCRGFAHDLESNFASSCEVVEATIKKDGTPYDERMRLVIAKAALSKARRDATFQVVPKALCKPIESAARAVALGDATTIEKRRENVMTWISRLSIPAERVFAALGVKGEADIGIDQLATLVGLKTAIKDNEVTVDEAFPPIIPPGNIGQKPAQTPTEAAAAEKSKDPTKKKDIPAEKAPAAATAEDLVKQLISKAADISATRGVLQGALQKLGLLSDDEVLSGMNLEQVHQALSRWPEIEALIVKPS